MLRTLFPEVQFKNSEFTTCMFRYFFLLRIFASFLPFLFVFVDFFVLLTSIIATWREIGDRRGFFENYAANHSFNHQDPEGWYKQPLEMIMSTKVLTKEDNKKDEEK